MTVKALAAKPQGHNIVLGSDENPFSTKRVTGPLGKDSPICVDSPPLGCNGSGHISATRMRCHVTRLLRSYSETGISSMARSRCVMTAH